MKLKLRQGLFLEWDEYRGKAWYEKYRNYKYEVSLITPDGILLKCCLACRHGNLCPVGNCEKEVFCMQDIVPKDKEDLYFYTEDENERRKRSRMYFDCCETFAPWCKECYTYNDFGHYLN